MKKFLFVIAITILFLFPTAVFAEDEEIEAIIDSMTTEEKVAQMIMPSFRWSDDASKVKVTEITPDIEDILKEYNFAGVILYGQNSVNTEQLTRLIDDFQKANAENPDANSQLFIAIDQEGGYVTRLAEGTALPGNMALGATGDSSLAYESATIIGTELDAVGVNTNFAPVVDVNNNPANPVIGIRSFSDDPDMVTEFASEFKQGLEDTNIIPVLKHFPGHGDASEDTHSETTVVDKSKEELLEMELKPFQALINEGVEMIMTAHLQFPQIESDTYHSKSLDEDITLPATLSDDIITGLLREEMGYNGVVITDSLDMGAITNHFDLLDVATLAINAGADILLTPVETKASASFQKLKDFISDVADLVDNNTISEGKVNSALRRILSLKKKKGLLETYNVDIDEKVANALKVVSTKESHEREFEIAKQAITLVKNDNDVLPLNGDDKTLFLYYYTSHIGSGEYAFTRLINDGIISSSDNFLFLDYEEEMDKIKEEIVDAKNVVIIHAMYDVEGITSFNSILADHIDEVLELCSEYNVNSVFVSTHYPYDIGRFNNSDAIIATYLANGLTFDLENASEPIKKYGPNLIAGIYLLFDKELNFTGKLPVNIYKVDENNITNEILYPRGYGLPNKNNTNNPETNDSIIYFIMMLTISIFTFIGTGLYIKKDLFN